MKKNILIICAVLATFSFMAFSYINRSIAETSQEEATCSNSVDVDTDFLNTFFNKADVDLSYDVGSRYMRTVTKEDLHKAKSILDIVPEDPKVLIESYYSVTVNILDDNYNTVISETGDGPKLTAAQIKLLRSVDYSTDIMIRSEYQQKSWDNGALRYNYSTPYVTVVPEKQAVYAKGNDKLIAYAKENTKEFAAIVKENEIEDGKVTFTVTKEGKVANASITATSGYPALDKKMVDLVSNMPGTWESATNSKGEKIEQKFVFSFGIFGC